MVSGPGSRNFFALGDITWTISSTNLTEMLENPHVNISLCYHDRCGDLNISSILLEYRHGR